MIVGGANTIKTFEDAAKVFRDHEGMSVNSVREWSVQFGTQNQQLALKILKNITYYSGATIRQMVEDLVDKVCNHLHLCDRKKILFIPIGEPYEGSAIIARALRSCRGIHRNQIKHQRDLADVPPKTNIRAILLLDVFSGTGNQILDWWTNMETLLLPWKDKSIELILGVLALNYKAARVLKTIPTTIQYTYYLDVKSDVLSKQSRAFSSSEKQQLKKFCRKTGCPSDFLYGKGNCGLLLSFRQGCPNNSLPILWFSSGEWKNIFLRRGL